MVLSGWKTIILIFIMMISTFFIIFSFIVRGLISDSVASIKGDIKYNYHYQFSSSGTLNNNFHYEDFYANNQSINDWYAANDSHHIKINDESNTIQNNEQENIIGNTENPGFLYKMMFTKKIENYFFINFKSFQYNDETLKNITSDDMDKYTSDIAQAFIKNYSLPASLKSEIATNIKNFINNRLKVLLIGKTNLNMDFGFQLYNSNTDICYTNFSLTTQYKNMSSKVRKFVLNIMPTEGSLKYGNFFNSYNKINDSWWNKYDDSYIKNKQIPVWCSRALAKTFNLSVNSELPIKKIITDRKNIENEGWKYKVIGIIPGNYEHNLVTSAKLLQ